MKRCVYVLPWLVGVCLVWALPACAYDVWNDPFETKSTLPAYSTGLTTPECPAPPVEGQKLGLTETVAIVICRNPDAKTTLQGLFSSAASLGSARSAYLPTLDGSVGWGKSTSFSDFGKTTSLSRSSGLSVGYTLFDFGKRNATVQGAEYALQVSGLGYRNQLQGLIASTLQAYYTLLASTESLRAARESEAYAKAAFEAANVRYSIGQVPLSDTLQAEAAYSQSQLSRQQAENQLALNKGALARLMSAPPEMPYEIGEIDEGELYASPLNVDVQQAMAWAKEMRPDLEAQRASLRGSRANYEATRKARLPSISLSAGTSSPTYNPVNRGPDGRSQSVGLSVSIPIFTGFSQTYSEKAAESQVRAAESQLDATQQNVFQEVWRAYQNYLTARQTWLTSLDTLASTLELKGIALGRYREGLGSILDLLNAQAQYSSSLQQQASAKYNLLTTRVELIRAMGTLDLSSLQPAQPGNQPVIQPTAQPVGAPKP